MVDNKVRLFYGLEKKAEDQIEIISFALDEEKNQLASKYENHFTVKNSHKIEESSLVYSPDSSKIAVVGSYKKSKKDKVLFYGVMDQSVATLHNGKLDFPPNPKFEKYGKIVHWSLNNKGSLVGAESVEFEQETLLFFTVSTSPSALRYAVLNAGVKTPKITELKADGVTHTSFFFKSNEAGDFDIFSIYRTKDKTIGIGSTKIDATSGANSNFALNAIEEAKVLKLNKQDKFESEEVNSTGINKYYHIIDIRFDGEGNPLFVIQQDMIIRVSTITDTKGNRQTTTTYYSGDYMVVKMSVDLDEILWTSILSKYHTVTESLFSPIPLYGKSTFALVYESYDYLKGERDKSKTSMRVWYVNLEDGSSTNERLDFKIDERTSALSTTVKRVSDTQIKTAFVDWGFGTYKDFYFGDLELVE